MTDCRVGAVPSMVPTPIVAAALVVVENASRVASRDHANCTVVPPAGASVTVRTSLPSARTVTSAPSGVTRASRPGATPSGNGRVVVVAPGGSVVVGPGGTVVVGGGGAVVVVDGAVVDDADD